MTTATAEHTARAPISSVASAFLRMDSIEDISYPMSLLLGELGTIAPVLIYYFVGQLVGDNPEVDPGSPALAWPHPARPGRRPWWRRGVQPRMGGSAKPAMRARGVSQIGKGYVPDGQADPRPTP